MHSLVKRVYSVELVCHLAAWINVPRRIQVRVYVFILHFISQKTVSFCPVACLQAGTRRIYERTNTMDLDWFLWQSALHQPHRGQNGNSGSVGWGVQGVHSGAFIEKEVISRPASGASQGKVICGQPSFWHCCWKDLENIQTELAITGGEKIDLVMLFFSPPLHQVPVSVSGSLINLWFDSGNFLFPECSKCRVLSDFSKLPLAWCLTFCLLS